jgi:hypothetical protein
MGARRSSVMIREGTTEEKERQRREAAARQTLRPGNRADPGLASVRRLDWLGPNRKTRRVHRHTAQRAWNRTIA